MSQFADTDQPRKPADAAASASARQRLIGAAAICLVSAAALPFLFDSEPKHPAGTPASSRVRDGAGNDRAAPVIAAAQSQAVKPADATGKSTSAKTEAQSPSNATGQSGAATELHSAGQSSSAAPSTAAVTTGSAREWRDGGSPTSMAATATQPPPAAPKPATSSRGADTAAAGEVGRTPIPKPAAVESGSAPAIAKPTKKTDGTERGDDPITKLSVPEADKKSEPAKKPEPRTDKPISVGANTGKTDKSTEPRTDKSGAVDKSNDKGAPRVGVTVAAVDGKADKPAKPAAEKSADSAKAGKNDADGVKSYFVQVGAFRNSEGVSRAVNAVQATGQRAITDEIKLGGGTATRVRVGPFKDRDSAGKARDALKAQGVEAAVIAP